MWRNEKWTAAGRTLWLVSKVISMARSLASASDTMNGIHSGGQGSWHTYKKTCSPRNLTSPLQDEKFHRRDYGYSN